MAKKSSSIKPKEWLLLSFVALCVVLVGLIWYQGLTDQGGGAPGYVRPTADFELEEADYENWNNPSETPTEGSGSPTPESVSTAAP